MMPPIKAERLRVLAHRNAVATQRTIVAATHSGPHALVGLDFPKMPSKRKSGAYDPAELIAFISNCRMRQIRPDQIALKLGVEQHRIIYFMRDGIDVLRRRLDDWL